tara:strand:- start:295 stop:969 length:675 start_codon:yes stop_codon:yes gene_type:complete
MEKRIIPVFIQNEHLSSSMNELIPSIDYSDLNMKFYIVEIMHDVMLSLKNDPKYIVADEDFVHANHQLINNVTKIFLINTSGNNIEIGNFKNEIIIINIPFSIKDLLLSVSNLIGQEKSQFDRKLQFNLFTYDPSMRVLSNEKTSLRFTEKESQIFECMLNNNNVYLSKKILLEKVWSYNDTIDTHTLETHIYSLRKKIEEKLLLKDLIIFEENKGYFLNKDIL